MLIYWFLKLLEQIDRLIFPPDAKTVARIDKNFPCPVCGARKGRLRCVRRSVRETGSSVGVLKIFCQHTCFACGARFYENPVVKLDSRQVVGAIARDDLEKLEDSEYRNSLLPVSESITRVVNGS